MAARSDPDLDAVFANRPRRLRVPRDMAEAPLLDPALPAPRLRPRHALLVNPFYPKDPHASFGKHVLTPTLALTSVAAATPPGWSVAAWASIWRRRPEDARAVLPYLAMSWFYKRSNAMWHVLIRHGLVRTVWSPLVEATRRRHVKFRRRLAGRPVADGRPVRAEALLPAGV